MKLFEVIFELLYHEFEIIIIPCPLIITIYTIESQAAQFDTLNNQCLLTMRCLLKPSSCR